MRISARQDLHAENALDQAVRVVSAGAGEPVPQAPLVGAGHGGYGGIGAGHFLRRAGHQASPAALGRGRHGDEALEIAAHLRRPRASGLNA